MDWCGHYFSSRVVTGSACLKPMQIHATRPSQLTIVNDRDSVTHSLSDRTHVVSVVAATLCPSEIFTRACVARPRFPGGLGKPPRSWRINAFCVIVKAFS